MINEHIAHWPPSELENMPLGELYRWFDLAIERYEHKLAQQEDTDDG